MTMHTSKRLTAIASVFGIALAILATPSVAQNRVAATANSLKPPSMSTSVTTSESKGGGNYSEDFETFTVGPLVPQGGWTSDFEQNANVISPGLDGSTRAAQHTTDGTGIFGLELISPEFTSMFGYLELTQVIEGNGSRYQFNTLDTNTGNFNTRVNFETDGSITAGQLNMAGDAIEPIPTSGSWTSGVPTRIGIEVTESGELFVYQDGTQIFAGTEVNFDFLGTPGQIGQVLNGVDNIGSTDSQTWDDINLFDEPPRALPESLPVPIDSTWTLILMMLVLSAVGAIAVRRFG
jgi:hypothetical protein